MRKFFVLFSKVQCSPVSTIKQDRESGVVSLCWTEIPDQNMIINLNLLVATIRSFKMLIDYTLDLWHPPFSPCPHPSPKRKRRRNCCRIPTSTGIGVAHVVIANTPSKFFRLHLGTNFLSFWLGSVSFSNLFLFSFPLPPMLLLKSSHQSQLSVSHASPWVKRASFWLA